MQLAALILPAFLAGFVTFFAPCTFPLVPGFLAFISGQRKAGDVESARVSGVVRNALLYVLGFSVVFIALGSLFGLGGAALVQYRDTLAMIGGVFVIVFGLFLLGVIRVPGAMSERRLALWHRFEPGRPLSSFLFGATFAFAWSPCVGPVLGTVLTLAATRATVAGGALLLTIFSLGLALPFLLLALVFERSRMYVAKIQPYLGVLQTVGGVLIVFLGVLLVTNSMDLWISWVFRLFAFLRYDGLLDYM